MTDDGSIFGLSPRAPGSNKSPRKKTRRGASDKDQEPRSSQPEAAGELEIMAPGRPAPQAQKSGPVNGPASWKTMLADPDEGDDLLDDDEPLEDDERDEQDQDEPPKAAPRRKRPARSRSGRSASAARPEDDAAPDAAPAPRPQAPPAARPQAPARREAKPQPERPPRPEPAPAPRPAPKAPATEDFAATAPDEVIAPEDVLPEATLDSLPQALQDACARAGWDKLMPVQALAMPYLLAGQDLMIQSRTGSGKTGVFVLPIMDRVNTALDQCQALVLVPTRELAQQVAREAEMLAEGTGMRVAAVYGGAGYGPQLDALRQGAHLVVGTPGRVLDHLMRGSLSLQGIEVLVFDEADRMLSIGFYPDMREVQRYLPSRKVTMLMTSATYPPHVMRLAGEFMEHPQLLSLSHKRVHVAETPHLYYECKPMEKDRALVRIIEMENPASAFIFCNTKQNVHYVTAVLQRFGYDADELSGDLTQVKREQVLDRIRRGKLRFLVATDVAARGIDIPDLSHVFLYEPPEDHEVYIHRAGRTGRAGASGEVVSLVDVMEKLALHRIGKMYKISLEARLLPTDEDVQKAIAQRMTALLEGRLRKLDNVERERIERFKLLAKTLADGEAGIDLVAMLLDETYRTELQGAPPKPPAREQAPKARAPREDRRRDRDEEPAPREAAPAPEAEAPREAQPAGEDGEAPAPKKRRRRRRKKKKPAEGAEGAEAAGNGEAQGAAPEGADDEPGAEGWDHDEDEDDGPSPGQNWPYDEQ